MVDLIVSIQKSFLEDGICLPSLRGAFFVIYINQSQTNREDKKTEKSDERVFFKEW